MLYIKNFFTLNLIEKKSLKETKELLYPFKLIKKSILYFYNNKQKNTNTITFTIQLPSYKILSI